MDNCLINYKVKVEWEDGEEDEYLIHENKSQGDLIGYEKPFAQSLIGLNIGEKQSYDINGYKNTYKLKELYCEKLEHCIKERELEFLYHFTDIENLTSILENGLLSKDKLNNLQVIYNSNDSDRLENKTDCICCSIEYPNNRLRYTYEINYKTQFIIIELDINLLRGKNSYCSPSNAARNAGREIMPISFIENLFIRNENSSQIFKKFPTDEQAEVLVKGHIELCYVTKIYVKDLLAKMIVISELENKKLQIPVIIDNSIFYRR
ncbi:MAG: DarT ssDNA thymidine ADP-ribosyltransferase family protein [Spirochaetales bacterium]